MDRSSETIQLDLKTAAEMFLWHQDRAFHYYDQCRKFTMELNRARRLEREAKELHDET